MCCEESWSLGSLGRLVLAHEGLLLLVADHVASNRRPISL